MSKKIKRESDLEDYLHARVVENGGEYRRTQWIGRKHAPDDLIGFPLTGRHCWIELKIPGEEPRKGQDREHDRMLSWGCDVRVAKTKQEIDQIIEELATP